MRRKIWTRVLPLAALVGTAVVYLYARSQPPAPEVVQAAVTRGDVVEVVNATGTLQPTRSVNVGSQVSGTVKRLFVDFNAIVHAGQIIAQIDPSLLDEALASATASLERARIQVGADQDTLQLDEHDRDRAEAMYQHDVAALTDREVAELQVTADEAQIQQDEGAVTIAEAAVDQARQQVAQCTIRSPIDGVVISRAVDEGQTVTANASAPTLYVLATNLTSLDVLASVDEADVSRLRPGQRAVFTVEAYPESEFSGTVESVRLNTTTTNNVVTYEAVITAPNPDLRLRPGMTARLRAEVSRVLDVVRVPAAALRFRPTRDVFAAFHQPAIPPPPLPSPVMATAETRSAAAPAIAAAVHGDATIDRLFAPAAKPDEPGDVWIRDASGLSPVHVRVGVSDGTWTELLSGSLQPGQALVTGVVLAAASSSAPGLNPLVPQPRGGRRFGS